MGVCILGDRPIRIQHFREPLLKGMINPPGFFLEGNFSFLRLTRQLYNVKIIPRIVDIINVTNPGTCPCLTVKPFISTNLSTSDLQPSLGHPTHSFLRPEVKKGHGLEKTQWMLQKTNGYLYWKDPYMFLLWYLNPLSWNDRPYHYCMVCFC